MPLNNTTTLKIFRSETIFGLEISNRIDRLSQLQKASQNCRYMSDEAILSLAEENLVDKDFRIRGEMCYALGRSRKGKWAPIVQDLLIDTEPWVRNQAKEALEKIEIPSDNGNGRKKIQHLNSIPIANFQEFDKAKDTSSKLIHLQKISQISEYLSEEVLRSLVSRIRQSRDPRIIGELCYALGRSNNPTFIAVLKQLTSHSDAWVQKQAKIALEKLKGISIIKENDILLYAYNTATPAEIIASFEEIKKRIEDFPLTKLKILVDLALDNYTPEVRLNACALLDKLWEIDKLQALQFEQKLAGISQQDSDSRVREYATRIAGKLSIFKDSKIDLEIFRISDTYRKLEALQNVSKNLKIFPTRRLFSLIKISLRDPDPAIRGQAILLLDEWIKTGARIGYYFEPRVRRMAFKDPNLWVCKQAVLVAQNLFWPAFYWRLFLFVVTYMIVGVILFFGIPSLSRRMSISLIPVAPVLDCDHSYAHSIVDQIGTEDGEDALGKVDGDYASIGYLADSELILDMGDESPIVTKPGVDFYFYERPYGKGIQLDSVIISIAQDDGTGHPTSFIPVFIWGDNEPSNNGTIPSEYFPNNNEIPDLSIPSSALYNGTGIGVDVGGGDGISYRFIRFQTYPSNKPAPRDELLTEVDAIEVVLCPPPSPTATGVIEPTETIPLTFTPPLSDTVTFTLEPIETVTETYTSTPFPTPSSAIDLTGTTTMLPAETFTATLEPTNLPTHTPSSTIDLTGTTTMAPSETFTATTEPTNSPIPTPTATPTSTITAIPTGTFTTYPTNTHTPLATVLSKTPTATNTHIETSTITFTSIPIISTFLSDTPIPTITLQPRVTKTATHVMATITLEPTLIPTTLSTSLTTKPIITQSPTYATNQTQVYNQITPVKTKSITTITPLSTEIPEQPSVLARTLLQIVLVLLFTLLTIAVLVRIINWSAIQNRFRELFAPENDISHPFASANLLPDLLIMRDRVENKLGLLVENAINSGLTEEGLTKEGMATELSQEIAKLNGSIRNYDDKISMVRNAIDQ